MFCLWNIGKMHLSRPFKFIPSERTAGWRYHCKPRILDNHVCIKGWQRYCSVENANCYSWWASELYRCHLVYSWGPTFHKRGALSRTAGALVPHWGGPPGNRQGHHSTMAPSMAIHGRHRNLASPAPGSSLGRDQKPGITAGWRSTSLGWPTNWWIAMVINHYSLWWLMMSNWFSSLVVIFHLSQLVNSICFTIFNDA